MRRNDHDVTDQIRTTGPDAVRGEILRLYRERYSGASSKALETACADTLRMYDGGHPDFHACDTEYHDLQYVLDVTLATARTSTSTKWRRTFGTRSNMVQTCPAGNYAGRRRIPCSPTSSPIRNIL